MLLWCGLSFRVCFSFLMELDCVNTCCRSENKNFHSEKYESEAREAMLAGERGSWEKFLQFKINSCTGTDKTFWEERNCYFFKCANFKALRVGAGMLSGRFRCCNLWLKAFNINQRCSARFPLSIHLRITHPSASSLTPKRPKPSQRTRRFETKRELSEWCTYPRDASRAFVNSKHDCWKNICLCCWQF